MKPRIILYAYLLACIANIIGNYLGNFDVVYFSKPLLMPLLLFYVYRASEGTITINRLLLAGALMFSWAGDLALMYEGYFLVGVGFFFVAQVVYIIVFAKSTYQKITLQFRPLLPLALYGIGFFYVLLPQTEELFIPVLIYGLSLITMAGFARLRQGLTANRSFNFVAIGGAAFLISDSLIALNKFVDEIPFSGVWVMVTYCLAQYLIVVGILEHPE
ncbi:MAG: lysoplasmalogenase [Cyclobacteriaceae bacterium]